MPVLISLILLLLAFIATPVFTRLLGRNAGWILAAFYIAAAAAQAPAAGAVAAGERTAWSLDWLPALGIRWHSLLTD